MSDKMVFFSYSRDNSDFVLNLAKELRTAGANVWLDQLDIKPGSRWDKSIEAALDKAGTVLVVLSKASVGSNNVMDEVSYALEEGKTVIPVLLEDCDVPFRLRRLQFADFTKSHIKGTATLSRALGLASMPPKPEFEPPKPHSERPDDEIKTERATSSKESKEPDVEVTISSRFKSKPILYIVVGIAVIIGALAIGGVFSKNPDPIDRKKKLEEIKKERITPVEVEERPNLVTIGEQLNAIAKAIKFESARPNVKEGKQEINELVEILKKNPTLKIDIGCHTDSMGSDEINKVLSQKRADFIKTYLVDQGIEAKRINAVGFGESKPIAENRTSQGRAINRRVEITVSM